ncbi:glycosyl hydrolase [Methanofollis fontis]|uniref:Glycosyl hydrolase n=2 Tax=Methanofollis fontis TaxID=2052832 RepID=A0A483CMC7_9EURY|nr:glycosyl hydrolase [Methanofollis fontis]
MKSEAVLYRNPDSRTHSRILLNRAAICNGGRSLAAIPCFNESITIGTLVIKARRYVDDVLVIDDGSTDDTQNIARDAGALVIRHLNNSGKGDAVRSALEYARIEGYDYLILLDGDGQHNPEEIPDLLAPLKCGQADVVIGSRFLDTKNDIPVYRRFGQSILTMMTNVNSNSTITDSQSGFRALGKNAISLWDADSDGYNIESDMIASITGQGLSIREIPISVKYDVPNKHKKNPLTHGLGVFKKIVCDIGYQRPLFSFGIAGALLVVAGLFSGVIALSSYVALDAIPVVPSVFCGLCMVTGLMLLISGVTLNYISHHFIQKSPVGQKKV